MKKQKFFVALLILLLTFSAVHAQFRIYNSELLKVGDINEAPFISKGFEASMPNILLKSNYMGLRNTASMLQLGKLNSQYNCISGIKIDIDSIALHVASNSGIKIYETALTGNVLRGSSTITSPMDPPLRSEFSTRIESFGNKLIIGSRTNEVGAIYSKYYYSNETNSVLAPSDIRCKTNIRDIESSLNGVNSIRIVRFDYFKMDSIQEKVVDPNRSNRVGVIAQELLEIYPEAVHYNEQNDMMMVDYGALIPFLIKAIQEQQAEIDELKKSIH